MGTAVQCMALWWVCLYNSRRPFFSFQQQPIWKSDGPPPFLLWKGGGGTKPGLNIKDKDVKKEKEEKTKVGTGLVIILKASLT